MNNSGKEHSSLKGVVNCAIPHQGRRMMTSLKTPFSKDLQCWLSSRHQSQMIYNVDFPQDTTHNGRKILNSLKTPLSKEMLWWQDSTLKAAKILTFLKTPLSKDLHCWFLSGHHSQWHFSVDLFQDTTHKWTNKGGGDRENLEPIHSYYPKC